MLLGQLALIAAAAFAGAALYVSVVEHPARLNLVDGPLLAQWQPSYKRGAIMQGSLAMLGGLCGIAAFVMSPGWWNTSWLWLMGALVLLANWPYTLMIIKPVNDQLLEMIPEAPGPNVRALLEQWGKLHLNRTFLGLGATALFVLASL